MGLPMGLDEVSPSPLAPQCLALDLEVGRNDHRIHQFGAVRGDSGETLRYNGGDLDTALSRLDTLADSTAFLLGHNLVEFDLPHLKAHYPSLRLHQKPVFDTLRLNPLAFPRNPYHHLVKHYQDGRLHGEHRNDPVKDAQLALEVFRSQHEALKALNYSNPELLAAWHWLTTQDDIVSGVNRFFMKLRNRMKPSAHEAEAAILHCLAGQACASQSRQVMAEATGNGWPLAYALAWLSVAGGNSVMPPWVRYQFPQAAEIVRRLRDTACNAPACRWCREHHDAQKELKRWFGFDCFRPEPADPRTGRPLQQVIVEAAMGGQHVLGILPTGTGKSLCYQIPALSRFEKTGALTVVISPLVALMADQVAGLAARGIHCCAALNGLLSQPERADVLDRVRMGDIGILTLAPEQLRSQPLRKALAQREIGAWVLDEAHCLSKWGHDFRPDYRYVSRFIKEKAGEGKVPPVLCLTATAKPEVVSEILAHFRERVGIELLCFDGGARRENLDFRVVQSSLSAKLADLQKLLEHDLPPDVEGGAIVYASTRAGVEEIAGYLSAKGWSAGFFHAGLSPERKKSVQEAFIRGELRVIVATNAFGMGIDKPDVRLVIHADIPGSLENYLQEAGRAGRDRGHARCVLLYTPDDVERQFSMSAHSRLSRKEIQVILRSLRSLSGKKSREGKRGREVTATPGEILAEDDQAAFQRDSTTDDTRVRTAVSWLEEAHLLTRDENQVQVFPSSLRVNTLDEARKRIAHRNFPPEYARQLLTIVETLIDADADDGVSTDELMGATGLSSEGVRKALADLEQLGIASNDAVLTAYVHVGVERASEKRLQEVAQLEAALIAELREQAPDLQKGGSSMLHLRTASQHMKDAGHARALPETLRRILKSLAADGRSDAENMPGSMSLARFDEDNIRITLNRDWQSLAKTAQLRHNAARVLLQHLAACLPEGSRGIDQLAETTMGKLLAALDADLLLKSEIRNAQRCLEHALLWLHEQEVIRLNRGLTVFRPAMTIRLEDDWKKQFQQSDFESLNLHYKEQVTQIHVMAEYARLGLEKMAEALRLTMEYFMLRQEEFLRRWLPGREKELDRQTTPESWANIVESLGNKSQRDIVADNRENINLLVLAGPGSGKTRVLVHRIAYLVRVRRENPRGIVALAYNRHAAAQIRRRLHDLIGEQARWVVVLTLHALAMRLVGASFVDNAGKTDADFRQILLDATALLRGDGMQPEEADLLRDRLLAGFRWILVDEYQDIGQEEYDLISALAGRTRTDDDGKINLLAVGDDDQNIYGFKGASSRFIRHFEAGYQAKIAYLTDNYRSTTHIIAAANALIDPAGDRMKARHPIHIDRKRANAPPGGEWQTRDSVAQGRVQILHAGSDQSSQAMAVMAELERLAARDSGWSWARCAVIARNWDTLEPVRAYCEWRNIPVQSARQSSVPFWKLRETQALLDLLMQEGRRLLDMAQVNDFLARQGATPPWEMLREACNEYALETEGAELPVAHFRNWLAEWGREARRRQTGLLLVTAHSAKGLEFDHVAVLDGGWQRGEAEDADAVRRLYYVAMTRARKTLALARMDQGNTLVDALPDAPCLLRRPRVQLIDVPPQIGRQYRCPGPEGVNLGYAARRPADDTIHQRIARLEAGSPLQLQEANDGWFLLDGCGERVGKMAGAFSPPPRMRCIDARVHAVMTRCKDDVDLSRFAPPKVERWEVILPELVFAPTAAQTESAA